MSLVKLMVLSNFQKLINFDPTLSGLGQHLLAEGMNVDNGECIFNIISLHNWVKTEVKMGQAQFRTELYQSDLNAELRKLGYIIEINYPTGKVDTSTYRLRKL